MRRLCLLFVLFAPLTVEARGFGLGLEIGDPTGISGKTYLSRSTAVDGTLGLNFLNGNRLSLHIDFVWEKKLSRLSTGPLNGYLGIGGKMEAFDRDHDHKGHDHDDDDRIWLGGRAPFGIDFVFTRTRLDLFIEIAVVLWVVEEVDVDLDGAIGLRYWF